MSLKLFSTKSTKVLNKGSKNLSVKASQKGASMTVVI